ncbi:MAG TPA: helix-turn-helix domain-containing protein [Streptosporangiaceae bacterium]|nr:helix-turn-helix domain-containing protein [Streptosporangiaceae bacterium]
MPTVDEILAGSPLAGLRRVSSRGGDRGVTVVRLAERFAELDDASPGCFVVLSRLASAEVTDYRLDMALRWAAIRRVAAVAAFSAEEWQPAVTALDIAEHSGIALVSVPADADLAALIQALFGEIGGGAGRALARAEHGLEAVRRAERAGAGPEELGQAAGRALGTKVEYLLAPPEEGVSVPLLVGETPSGHFAAPEAGGEIGIAAGLVLNAAAAAAARFLDLARRALQTPVRSRSELLAELLMSDSAISEDLLDRARQLGIPVSGWHLAVRIEADDLDEAEHDEVRRFELLESAGQAALQAVSAAGETWYLSRIARAIILIRVTTSNPGPQAGARAARAGERALQAIMARLPTLRFRAGVGTAHEGPMGLRASAAEARGALAAARAARRPAGVAAHDAVGIRRMLMEWYASDTVRASVRDQLAPLEKLGPARADTAIRTLAVYLDEQGSVVKTAERLHLHRNAVTNRLRSITELLDVDLDDPDQRLALQLACRARLLG